MALEAERGGSLFLLWRREGAGEDELATIRKLLQERAFGSRRSAHGRENPALACQRKATMKAAA